MSIAQQALRDAILAGATDAMQAAAAALTQEPILELAGQIEGLQAALVDLAAQRQDLLPQRAALREEFQAADLAWQAAGKRRTAAVVAGSRMDSRLDSIRTRQNEARLRIEQLEGEIARLALAATAPVVHDLRFQRR